MIEAIEKYQQAYRTLQAANAKLEELRRTTMPFLTHRVDTKWDEDGNATNWQDVWTTDKAIQRQFKSFQSQVKTVYSLSTKVNLTQRRMIGKIEEAANGSD